MIVSRSFAPCSYSVTNGIKIKMNMQKGKEVLKNEEIFKSSSRADPRG